MLAYINTFVIKGDDRVFEELMAAHEEYLRTQPGFGGFELNRSDTRPGEYVNIVQWSDEDSHARLRSTKTFQVQVTNMLGIADVSCSEVVVAGADADVQSSAQSV
ncbi:antibiotic biosynthesis monooxygenase [Sphaerisporangium sp. TRM90804]|uniref:antibiotic biosynthesis monooxygenase family protein n=1 Tax=Sphaerisporangium sp. TRM90804 TaxID=3031113 RepID=UPI00244D12B9|nr:antibiotic biosynthesis monooxygenase [Sphaerisporangium sp. TRM90804]MDH2429195.1 antibiotic biosynthesis monooxygenase [Sphaerisporangium sp. TRM90804]